jgi:cyclopropane fatty-acyl-phospholipid synthase-like methyltransferase
MGKTHSPLEKARYHVMRIGQAAKLARPSARRAVLVGPPEIWELKRRFQFDFLTSHGLRPEHRLLDIGCGVLRGGIPLIEYLDTGNYAGIEARAHVLDEGRKELAAAALEHKRPLLINESDPAKIQLQTHFDFVWAHSVLYHMTDDVVDAYMGLVAACLSDRGELYANVMLREDERPGERPAAKWQGFPVLGRTRDFYQRVAESHGLAVQDVGTLESLGDSGAITGQDMMLRFAHAGA